MSTQNFVPILALLGLPGLAYLLVAGGVAWLALRKAGRRPEWALALWISIASGVLVYIFGFALFEVAGSYLRDRPEIDLEDTAIVAFLTLWAFVLVFGYTVGYITSHWLSVHGKSVGLTAGASLLVFMALTIPITDFFNSCNLGVTFFFDASC